MIFEDPVTHWVYSKEGYWLPPICMKQYSVFDDQHRFLLVTGPVLTGKTVGIEHKVLRHAYDNPGARIGVFAKTTKTGKSGGPWQHLTEVIIPIWEKAGIGFRLVQRPKVTGDTRQNMFVVQSRFGPPSEVLLHSLEYAPEAEEKLKSTSYSMIWFSEVDQIAPMSGPHPDRDDREVFVTAQARLRMENVPYEAHQIIMDCNPPEDGEDHWLHDIFWKERERKDHPDPEYQKQIGLIEFQIADNPFLDPRMVSNIKNQFSFRQSLYERFVEGKWRRDNSGGHFSEMFKPEIHVLGKVQCPEDQREVIVPTPAVKVMLTGLDLGDKNNAFVIAEKLETVENDKRVIKFAILDELLITGREMPLRVFVEGMMEMIAKWEKFCLEKYNRKIQWRHWSDEAAWRYRQVAEAMDYLLVRNLSGGKINLKPAPKYKGSIRDRVQLLQQLLFENRIYFSAQLDECITMLKVLRKGNTVADYAAPPRRTHIFDALTYMLQSEAPVDEITYSDVVLDKSPKRLVICQ